MTVIRCVGIFKTINELISKILNTIPKGCHRVHVVAYSYRTVSWENKTWDARGEANRTIIKSVETKILDSREFLNNEYNKTELVDQIFHWFKINRAKVLNIYEQQMFPFQKKDLHDVNILIRYASR